MLSYDQRRIAARVSQHTVKAKPVPTIDVLHANVWRVTIVAENGNRSVQHILGLDAEHAIAVAVARIAATGKVTAVATLAPFAGLDEMEAKIALMAGESEAEKADRLARFQRMPESVL
jgi:spore maturation protein SpmB